jgi:hypothetical protein
MRHYLFVVAVAMLATGCATISNSPAQDFAYERVEMCKGVSNNVIFQRIESDGRAWVEIPQRLRALPTGSSARRKLPRSKLPLGPSGKGCSIHGGPALVSHTDDGISPRAGRK